MRAGGSLQPVVKWKERQRQRTARLRRMVTCSSETLRLYSRKVNRLLQHTNTHTYSDGEQQSQQASTRGRGNGGGEEMHPNTVR